MTLPERSVSSQMRPLIARGVFWIVAAFYAYGALVHVLNMASLTGFWWPDAPLKWQVLDVVYLLLDVTVVIGLIRGSWVGIAAFFLAALSQILLYTAFRAWVLDVPEAYRPAPQEVAYLDGLIVFHVLTCVALVWAMRAAGLGGTAAPSESPVPKAGPR